MSSAQPSRAPAAGCPPRLRTAEVAAGPALGPARRGSHKVLPLPPLRGPDGGERCVERPREAGGGGRLPPPWGCCVPRPSSVGEPLERGGRGCQGLRDQAVSAGDRGAVPCQGQYPSPERSLAALPRGRGAAAPLRFGARRVNRTLCAERTKEPFKRYSCRGGEGSEK